MVDKVDSDCCQKSRRSTLPYIPMDACSQERRIYQYLNDQHIYNIDAKEYLNNMFKQQL